MSPVAVNVEVGTAETSLAVKFTEPVCPLTLDTPPPGPVVGTTTFTCCGEAPTTLITCEEGGTQTSTE